MISLYRMDRFGPDSLLVFERAGSVLVQERDGSSETEDRREQGSSLGPARSRATDLALAHRLEGLVELGYRVLYGFIPPGSLPETERLLSEKLGVETIPDVRDGVPVWRTNSNGREKRPSYLLFTALSSETK